MPLSGGAANKLGISYEGLWTVDCMIDVMDEKANSIRLEPPGEKGEGVEFWLDRDDCREYHQVKRQNTQGRWSISDLASKRILSNFHKKLIETESKCVFVSTCNAHQLKELANRSRSSQSWGEFKKEFFSSKDLEQSFYKIAGHWSEYSDKEIEEAILAISNRKQSQIHLQIDESAQKVYELLKRVEVETESKSRLEKNLQTHLEYLVERDTNDLSFQDESPTIVDILAQFALDKVHHELNTVDIWHYLKQKKYRRREWGKDPHILAAVEDNNHRYVSRLKDIAIADKIIARDETQTILEKLKATEGKRVLLVTGEAGVGKSVVMLQVLDSLLKDGVLALSFQVDNLNPVAHPNDVGIQLQLPGSPATVLAGIAKKKECVLVIDQLDAVSSTSGRNPKFFECIDEIIQQALVHSNIHILIACRKFDLDYDHRLKNLTGEKGIAETINISRLTHDKVKEVVADLDLDAAQLSLKQLNLLSIPLHLYLLSEIAEDSDFNTLNFKTAKDLLGKFCNYKQLKLKERLGYSVKWTKVVDSLIKYMSKNQTLSAPKNIVRHYNDDAKAMASENILTWSRNKISFLHQSFFDYFFVDYFAESNINLLEFLYNNEQHLFRRTQAIQILIHERESDFDEYLEHLEELLTSDDIRFHIKQIVFAWLGTLEDPKEKEWEILDSIINGHQTNLINHAWSALRNSVGWFKFLDSLGLINKLINSKDEKSINKVIYLMWSAERESPDRVAELLKPLLDVSEEWFDRIGNLILRLELDKHRSLFDLLLHLIEKGFFDNKGDTDNSFWSAIIFLGDRSPEWACEAIGSYFNRNLELSDALGLSNPLNWQSDILGKDTGYEEILTNTATKASDLFIENTLPLLLHILKAQAKDTVDSSDNDPFLLYQCYGYGHTILDCLLDCIKNALCKLAESNPDRCWKIAEELNSYNFPTIQYLLNNIYIANTQIFLSQAFQYICHELSSTDADFSGRTDAEIKQLVQNITSSCSNDRLDEIERLILNYYPSWERGESSIVRGNFSYSQYILLNSIAPSRRSNIVNRRINELFRKFGKLQEERAYFSSRTTIATYTPSPVPESALEKMTDEQWIKAITKYSFMQPPFKKDDHLISIGAFIQSTREEARKKPVRFANLICKLPDRTNPLFFDAILRGIGNTEKVIDVDTVFNACQRCLQIPEQPCKSSILELIGNLAELSWNNEALDLIINFAINNSDDNRRLSLDKSSNGLIYIQGADSVRARSINAIASLIFADKTRGAYFQYALEQIVQDESLAVRACAAEALIAMLNYDRDLAVKLFLKLCDSEDIVLGTQAIDRFLYYATYTHFETLQPILERMIHSDEIGVMAVGARQSCVEALRTEEAQYLVKQSFAGTIAHRKALAEVFVANFRFAHLRQYCEDGLIKLFDDEDKKVRFQAARCFFQFEDDEIKDFTSLVEKFVTSFAFDSNCHSLLNSLEKTTAKLPQVTYLVCDRFIQKALRKQSEEQSYSGYTDKISQLLIKLYSQSKRQMRSQCLDLIDRLCEMNVYGLDKALVEYER